MVLIDHPQHGPDLFTGVLALRDVPAVLGGPANGQDCAGVLGAKLQELLGVHRLCGGVHWAG